MGSRFLSGAGICFAIAVGLVGGVSARPIAVHPDPYDCDQVLAACQDGCNHVSVEKRADCRHGCFQSDDVCRQGSGSGSPAITPVPKAIAPKAVQPPPH
jgi:hypothetical protein